MTIAVCVAGVTGWAGRAVAEAVQAADDLRLTAGVSRSAAGQDLGRHWNGVPNGVPILGIQ
jgi:4-hydroxy-tetrahydrodipicolinate reductase